MHQHHTPAPNAVAISKEERSFFVAFGERLSALRKERGITQVQLAETLGVSQQAITAYEGGQRRVPISTLPLLAETLDISIEELIGTPAKRSARKRVPGIEAATAARTHQRIAQGTATLRHADARYRPAAAGRISATPTTHKPRARRGLWCHSNNSISPRRAEPPQAIPPSSRIRLFDIRRNLLRRFRLTDCALRPFNPPYGLRVGQASLRPNFTPAKDDNPRIIWPRQAF